MNLVERAYEFAEKKHEGQVSKGTNDPYINHLIQVRNFLEFFNCPEHVIAAGILHDTIEDTETSENELKHLFGEKILRIVLDVSEDKRKSWEERKENTIKKMDYISEDALYVFAADKLSNISRMKESYFLRGENMWGVFNRGKEKQKWYFEEISKKLKFRNEPIFKKLRYDIKNFFEDI